MVQLTLRHITIPGQVPLLLAVPTSDQVGLASNRYLVYSPLDKVVSTNPYGNFTPPFDLYDPRFNIPEDTGIFFTSDTVLPAKGYKGNDTYIEFKRTEVVLMIFLPQLNEVYIGTYGSSGEWLEYTRVPFVGTQQADGSMSYRLNFEKYKPKKEGVFDRTIQQLIRLDLFTKPNGYVFTLNIKMPIDILRKDREDILNRIRTNHNHINSLQEQINQINQSIMADQLKVEQLTNQINNL